MSGTTFPIPFTSGTSADMDIPIECYNKKLDKWVPVKIDSTNNPSAEVMFWLAKFVREGQDVRVSILKR